MAAPKQPHRPIGNERSLTHGGARARKSLTTGDEFKGPAREIELRIQADYEQNGKLASAERRAHRQATVEEIYYQQGMEALERGDVAKATGYFKIFLWAGAKADKTYERVEAMRAAEGGALDYEYILAQGDDNN